MDLTTQSLDEIIDQAKDHVLDRGRSPKGFWARIKRPFKMIAEDPGFFPIFGMMSGFWVFGANVMPYLRGSGEAVVALLAIASLVVGFVGFPALIASVLATGVVIFYPFSRMSRVMAKRKLDGMRALEHFFEEKRKAYKEAHIGYKSWLWQTGSDLDQQIERANARLNEVHTHHERAGFLHFKREADELEETLDLLRARRNRIASQVKVHKHILRVMQARHEEILSLAKVEPESELFRQMRRNLDHDADALERGLVEEEAALEKACLELGEPIDALTEEAGVRAAVSVQVPADDSVDWEAVDADAQRVQAHLETSAQETVH